MGSLALLASLADFGVGFLLRQNYDFKPAFVASGEIEATVLIQGPSRAVHTVDSAIVAEGLGVPVYNLGANAGTIDEHYALLRHYVRYNDAPKTVLLEVHPGYFGDNSLKFHTFLFVPFLEDEGIAELVERYDPVMAVFRHVPLLGFARHNRELLRETMKGAAQWATTKGERNYKLGFNPRNTTWKRFAEYRFDMSRLTRETKPEHVAAYERYVTYARSAGIEVMFFTSPTYEEPVYTETALHALAARLDVPLLQFQDLELVNEPSLFYDETHVTGEGAKVFSRHLAARLKARLN